MIYKIFLQTRNVRRWTRMQNEIKMYGNVVCPVSTRPCRFFNTFVVNSTKLKSKQDKERLKFIDNLLTL